MLPNITEVVHCYLPKWCIPIYRIWCIVICRLHWVWVKQLKRGKINLYYYELHHMDNYYNGTKYVTKNTSELHFVFQKGKGGMLESIITEIAAMLKVIEANNIFKLNRNDPFFI
jgi:hypothetical protein